MRALKRIKEMLTPAVIPEGRNLQILRQAVYNLDDTITRGTVGKALLPILGADLIVSRIETDTMRFHKGTVCKYTIVCYQEHVATVLKGEQNNVSLVFCKMESMTPDRMQALGKFMEDVTNSGV